MTLPIHPIAVICDVDEAYRLTLEFREAGVLCLRKHEVHFRAVFREHSFIGIFWGRNKVITLLSKRHAHFAVPMPEFRTAFGLAANQLNQKP